MTSGPSFQDSITSTNKILSLHCTPSPKSGIFNLWVLTKKNGCQGLFNGF